MFTIGTSCSKTTEQWTFHNVNFLDFCGHRVFWYRLSHKETFQLTTVQVLIEDYAEKQALPQKKKKNMKKIHKKPIISIRNQKHTFNTVCRIKIFYITWRPWQNIEKGMWYGMPYDTKPLLYGWINRVLSIRLLLVSLKCCGWIKIVM